MPLTCLRAGFSRRDRQDVSLIYGTHPHRQCPDEMSHSHETKHGGLDMPTIVKERVDSKPTPAVTVNGLGVIAFLLGLVLAAALLASFLPPPPEVVPGPDVNFFLP
jgi:hypothetical protein